MPPYQVPLTGYALLYVLTDKALHIVPVKTLADSFLGPFLSIMAPLRIIIVHLYDLLP
jgi:hypothetical protein